MHKTHLEAIAAVQKLSYLLPSEEAERVEVVVCPAFTALRWTDPNASAAAAPFLDLNNDGIADKIVGIVQPASCQVVMPFMSSLPSSRDGAVGRPVAPRPRPAPSPVP